MFNQTSTVVGVKSFKGDVEGSSFDHTKLLVLLPFPERGKNLGMDVVEMPFGDSTQAQRFKDLKFPHDFDLELQATTKGLEIVNAKPKVKT
jgi:hypothetical protein